MAERDQQEKNRGNASPQGDGDDAQAREVGRVGSPARGGEGGYGNDTGFATGTQGSQEPPSGGTGDRTDGGER